MASGKYERSLINRAVRKLGYPLSSNAVALDVLSKYIKGRLRKSRAGLRSQMAEAALIVLNNDAETKPAKLVQKKARPGASNSAKRSDKFYSSWEWKKVRYEALKVNGRRCRCCGWQPGDSKQGYLVVDHIKPRSKHRDLELDISNMQVLCNCCNMGKSNIHSDDFRNKE